MSAPATRARGPWRMSGKRIYETRPKEGWRETYTVFPVAEILGSQNSEGENKASARLIAAAPDLLAALREMAEHWPPQKPESPAFMAYINAMSAIAKAEGRAGE